MAKAIKKAVFPVAGFGTRFLPATKAMPKELLPIVDKPLIQYAAEEAVAAGIDTLIFVTGRNKRAIEDHFDGNQELELALRSKGAEEQAEMVRNILPKNVECVFVRQPLQLGLGHAVLCAERVVGGDSFAVLLADDFVPFEYNLVSEMVNSFEIKEKAQLSVREVQGPDISKYGVVKMKSNSVSVSEIIEKPNYENAPSDLACLGRYILSANIFQILKKLRPGANGEIQLADALNILARNDLVEAVKFSGEMFDCGSISGFLEANQYVAKKRNFT